jgi:hypothetical protein
MDGVMLVNRLKVLLFYMIMFLSDNCQVNTATLSLTAASPSFADVSAAVNRANSGDTVIIPAGVANWGNNHISTNKLLYIQGAGIDQTKLSTSCAIYFEFAPTPADIAADTKFGISGMTLDGGGNNESTMRYCVEIKNQTTPMLHKCVIDHIYFKMCKRTLAIFGNVCGVMHSCNFTFQYAQAGTLYDSIMYFIGNNADSWDNHHPDPANPFGQSENFFVEDCSFDGNYWIGCGHGGRYSFRHNTFTNFNDIQLFDAHGNQPTLLYGSVVNEIYNNTISVVSHSFELLDHRGGYGIVHNNTITGGTAQYVWSYECDEYDDNLSRWPVLEPAHEHMWPQGMYYFNNYGNGTLLRIDEKANYDPGNRILENASFWNHNISFNGSTGVGVGPLSARPGTCTTGVGYWATDTNTLYRATAPNTWSVYYTPYTYPHPLRNR